jgi:hypothetical protein
METILYRKSVNVKLINNYLYYLNERKNILHLPNKVVNIEKDQGKCKIIDAVRSSQVPVKTDR